MKKARVRKHAIKRITYTLIVLIACFTVINLFTATTTLSNIEETWDGVEIATSFSGGNGTEENPYQIKSGSELAYLKQIVETNQMPDLEDKYFVLANDIDLGGHNWQGIGTKSGENEYAFSGHLDGQGYSIQNYKIEIPTIIDNKDYYGFFNLVENAEIKNINFNNGELITIASPNTTEVGLVATSVKNTTISNVAVQNSSIDLTKTLANADHKIGGLFAEVDSESTVENIYNNMSINDSNANSFGSVFGTLDGTATTIITQVTYENFLSINIATAAQMADNKLINNDYQLVESNGTLYISNQENITIESLLEELNSKIPSSYTWVQEGSILKITQQQINAITGEEATVPALFSFGRSAAIPLHETEITDTTVYINDLESDYNYYQGLNYTHSSTGTLPTGTNQGIYTNTNLVSAYIKYSGEDVNNPDLVGHVSLAEQQSEFVYYKYYPVENGYVTIELIDNPFADHPTDKAFNGWVTDYPNAEITFDEETYTRYVRVPVTYTNGVPDIVNITFNSSWLDANVAEMDSTNWTNAFAELKDQGMEPVAELVYDYGDMSSYYVSERISYGQRYPSNAYNAYLNRQTGTCRSGGGCTYYVQSGSEYNPDSTYYRYTGYRLQEFTPQPIGDGHYVGLIEEGDSVAGLYQEVSVNYGDNLAGYYSNTGAYQESGTCTSWNGCTYYELQQYYNSDGTVNVATADTLTDYYYLVTRDMNIIVLETDVRTSWQSEKPFTLTGIYNGNDYSDNTYYVNDEALVARADTRVEYIRFYSSTRRTANGEPTMRTEYAGNIYGNWHNLKLGRGITGRGGNYVVAQSVIAGSNSATGSSSNLTSYRLVVESGIYNTTSATNGGISDYTNLYVDGQVIYGSDYDRIANNNDNLEIYFCASGSWGGKVYSSSTQTGIALHTIVKSGSFGTSEYDYSTGIYIGGRNGGTHYAAREAIIEGGDIYNLIGGPLTAEGREDINDTYINIKGGTIDMVIGGAGASTTYGNRIINFTGGKVNYGVFGGSNGTTGSDNGSYQGVLEGSTLVYVGGTAVAGDDNIISSTNNTLFGVESGSIFGAGNGNVNSTRVGTVLNSNIIIDSGATIKQNVYGGGNYGVTGIRASNATSSNISIQGGTIKGSVYGGGNNNGSGSSSVTSAISINMTNGTVEGSVYGGSRTEGTVYGSTNINVLGGTIKTDVYGGGEGGYSNGNNPGTFVRDNISVIVGNTTAGPTIEGSVYGGSAYGTINGTSNNGSANNNTTNVTVNNGIITGSVFGGGKGSTQYTPRVYGNVTVTINNGSIGNVYGGNDAAGSPSNNDVVYLNGGTIGNAYGGGNQTGQTTTNIYLQGATVTNKLFGGSNRSGTVNTSNVYMSSGTAGYVYGGNNIGGTTQTANVTITGGTVTVDVYGGGSLANTTDTHLYLGNATLNNVYGGGEEASADTTETTIEGASIKNFFGGSNVSGTVDTTTTNMINGTVTNLYGGNNMGGTTNTADITIDNGTIGTIYGGGNQASSTFSNITINDGQIDNIFGGGNEAGLNTSTIDIINGTIGNIYGGSNESGNITTADIDVGGEIQNGGIEASVNIDASSLNMWDQWSTGYQTEATIEVTLTNNNGYQIDDWQLQLEIPDSEINSNYSSTEITENNDIYTMNSENRYYGTNSLTANGGTYTFSFTVYSNQSTNNFQATPTIINPQPITELTNPTIDNIFGGNNMGGVTSNANINIDSGTIGNVYGGGNEAEVGVPIVNIENATVNNVYGGGNQAQITGDTNVTITNSTIQTNIYGGGNQGEVSGNTEVLLTNSTILGSAYAGGNGATAIVNRNTTITVEGNTVIGSTSSTAPQSGCLFGGGNAAATGTESNGNSLATVNIVGATIYGNVYGGANTSVVYGKTDTNIGTNAVGNNNLTESDINIGGTVFGGGEANASGDENYDFSFISVTGAIEIDIDGLNYLNNNHNFIISGSIFGSGNASSSSGTSDIYIANLGTRDNPSKNISIQRANTVILDNTVMELEGTTDRTNEYSDIEYSLNRIDELNIKNNTVLLLQRNANLLQSFKSTVDVNGQEEKAAVIIDDDTKKVTKNVDNRLYMLANRNLNVTTNEAATAYGQVSGMTFFGMYNSYGNGSFSYGLYDDSVNYGDSGDAGDIIIGGSYVLGLHSLNHDITVDGFYSNFIDDAYTEISTAYIDPTPPDSNYYMWTIGIAAVNYSFTMTASKYSSLGTYELSMREFSSGDTTFEVIGFNSEGLTSGVDLIDSNEVPKVADTEEDANSILGLSMKTETSEWTAYGTTKLLSANDGTYTGDRTYRTDSQALAPSLMFYLYHAKNISLNQDLGTVVVTMQARTPINEIEYDVQLITVTIDLVAREYDDGNAYDASITYDKKYEMPAATTVNITNQSQFTAYFDLFAQDSFENLYGRDNTNYHALVTDYVLPVGTQITMLDYSSQDGVPEYYYFTVDEEEYNRALQQLETDNEITYRLSNFIKMGSTSENNTYDDQEANETYYDEERNRTMEEFIFIFDFKETETTGNNLNHYIRLELRNDEDRALITVLGIRQNLMYFNLYESSNIVLNQEVLPDNNYIYPNTSRHIDYQTAITYDQTENRESIINTNYESTSMGLNVTLFDQTGNQVSSSLLTGTSIEMDGTQYFADSEGVFRIKLSGKVSNLNKSLYFLTDENLPAGNYKMVFTLFASSDGLHNSGGLQYVEREIDVTVVPADNAIRVTGQDQIKIIDGNKRLNENGTSESYYRVTTTQNLTSPNLRVTLYKRNTDNKDDQTYTEINLDQVFVHSYNSPSTYGLTPGSPNELIVSNGVNSQTDVRMTYQDTLTSGTYRIVFRLYDQDQLIDEDFEYFIIKKETNSINTP